MRINKNLPFLLMLIGGLGCFVLASIVVSGWPTGVKPNIAFPYVYAGDALYQYALIQRAIEGWIFVNDRQGFPFASEWFDFPGSDVGNNFVSMLLGLYFVNYYAVANIYFLLGFFVTFCFSFYILRRIGVCNLLSFAAAFIFTFAPYHFSRMLMGHTFYTWYFVVPLYFYCGYIIFSEKIITRMRLAKLGACVAIAACFGVYFALFGAFTIFLCGLVAFLKKYSWRPLINSSILGGVISISVLANIWPSINFWELNGKNSQVAQRVPLMTEVYSLKPIHLLLPPPNHRIEKAAQFSQDYASTFPLSNTVSSVGLVGLLGIALVLFLFIKSMTGAVIESRLGILIILISGSLLVVTVGGLNVLFAIFVSPQIRGWDRFSIFIFFYLVASLSIWLSSSWNSSRPIKVLVIFAATCLAFFDQTPASIKFVSVTNREAFEADKKLITEIENYLPKGAAIYQIPYVDFPEAAPLHGLGTYDQMTGFLNSKELKWSAGGMMGRKAANFYKNLADKPLSDQVEIVKSMGFSGIYVQNRGYADNGNSVKKELTYILGELPMFERADGGVAFFKLR